MKPKSMKGRAQGKIETNHSENKTYSYTKGGANLGFMLRTDNLGGLEAFKDLLEQAIKDVTADINKLSF